MTRSGSLPEIPPAGTGGAGNTNTNTNVNPNVRHAAVVRGACAGYEQDLALAGDVEVACVWCGKLATLFGPWIMLLAAGMFVAGIALFLL
ncbi:hypothetical protein CSOJ01_06607 [Colletotrichum sojae]|uniref:Uncharacterized protein n=1 Tax=Colletotrichum sojae TaxID=2175907 RepID=A0A8H6MVK5_9PEZI|nr:hypothetical protein CSOJ01_06607 [Colletotrichum sojae]